MLCTPYVYAGEQDFSARLGSGLARRLLEALQSGAAELLLQQYHVDAMPPVEWSALRATNKTRVLAPPSVPGFHPPGVPAIASAELSRIGERYLPVVVRNATLQQPQAGAREVSILWQVNAQRGGGFVVELSSEYGVAKAPCDMMRLDAAGAVTVTLRLLKGCTGATEWITGRTLHEGALGAGAELSVVVAPGNVSFVHFGAAR